MIEPSSDEQQELQDATHSTNNGKWSQREHQLFLIGLQKYNQDWKKIAELVGCRNATQVRSHAQKYFNKKRNDFEKIGSRPIQSHDENDIRTTRSKNNPEKQHPKEVMKDREQVQEGRLLKTKKIKKVDTNNKEKTEIKVDFSEAMKDRLQSRNENGFRKIQIHQSCVLVPSFSKNIGKNLQDFTMDHVWQTSSSYFSTTVVPALNLCAKRSIFCLIEGITMDIEN